MRLAQLGTLSRAIRNHEFKGKNVRRAPAVLLLVSVLVAVSFAGPASAKAQPDVVQATLSGEGDPDGSGSAVLEITKQGKIEVICHRIEVENVARPLTGGGIITLGETGETVAYIIIPSFQDDGGVVEGCTGLLGVKTRELSRIIKDPGSYFLHLYNTEFPCDIPFVLDCGPGALIGQLQAAS
jgi:hypothetical protein